MPLPDHNADRPDPNPWPMGELHPIIICFTKREKNMRRRADLVNPLTALSSIIKGEWETLVNKLSDVP